MKIEEVYIRFTDIVNRNATNNNLSVDKSRFITLFNDIQGRYLTWNLEKRNEDVTRYISNLLVTNKKLSPNGEQNDRQFFKKPNDFFDHSNLKVYAKKSGCTEAELKSFEIKSENSEELWNDKNEEPSYEYRETFYYFSGENVSVFKKDFTISKVKLTYYRYPREVDIEGYVKIDGTQSTSIDPEFDNKSVNIILIAMAKEFASREGDANKVSIEANKLFTQI